MRAPGRMEPQSYASASRTIIQEARQAGRAVATPERTSTAADEVTSGRGDAEGEIAQDVADHHRTYAG